VERDFQAAYHTHEGAHWWSIGRRDMIVRLLDSMAIGPDARVIDVGCASGRLVEQLRARGHSVVTGVDLSTEAIAACRNRGLDDVHVMPANELKFDDGSYDVVIASDVLEHIEDDLGALLEWRRVVAPGGRIILFVPAHRFLWSQHDVANQHHRRYGRRDLLDRIRTAGLDVERVSGWNLALLPPAATVRTVRRLTHRDRELHHDLQLPAPWLNHVLSRLLSAENRLLERRDFGPGISLFAVATRPEAAQSSRRGA